VRFPARQAGGLLAVAEESKAVLRCAAHRTPKTWRWRCGPWLKRGLGSFVPVGTWYLRAGGTTDESLGYFRTSLAGLGEL